MTTPQTGRRSARRFSLWRGIASVTGGLLLWEFFGRFVVASPILFSPLSTVLATGWQLTVSGEIFVHLFISLSEFAGGFGLAAVVGVAVGLAMAVNRLARDLLDPWVSFLYSSPLVALMPLFIMVFGLGYASKAAIVFVVSVFPILLSTYSGVRTIDTHLLDVARAFNCTRLQRFTKILLPAALPYIVVGPRLGIGRGLTGVVVAELFAANGGVGYLIATAGQSFDTPTVLSACWCFPPSASCSPNSPRAGTLPRALAQHRSGTKLMNDVLLETRALGKFYAGRKGAARAVLSDVSVRVERGEFVCIVGASGCGKTTFLRMMAGLVTPDAGEILVGGRTVSEPGADRGTVFQKDSLLPWRKVVDNVVFGLEVQGIPRREALEKARHFIDLVGLSHAADLYPYELSGGMRQRVNLARALAIDPELLLVDEPFAALDAQTREVMQRELLRIWSPRRKTVLFITHQIDEAVYLADRVLVFGGRPGHVVAEIPVQFDRPRTLDMKRSAPFLAIIDDIWRLIEREVVDSSVRIGR